METAKGDLFQIIGVDVFIDKNLKPWVLEINDSPSMNINLNKEGGKGEGLITLKSEVDKYIKTRVLYQTFKLML
jgi:D-alanine-D-alanine ligase-like ATP-grasp enzyme